ncbi:MAG: transcriptional repressor LexA [Chloroflexi bacterium]|nr:transcriptional repressor LexA [Chloroflexota bacterium]
MKEKEAIKVLSERQQDILYYTQNFMSQRGYPPTIRDIQNGCGISSTSVVNYNLNILSRRGYMKRTKDVSRGIELTGDVIPSVFAGSMTAVPLLGIIAAGVPIEVPEVSSLDEVDEFINVSIDMLGKHKNIYALKVKGTSMIEAFINDGDTVILEATRQVENGQVAAVWLKNEQEITLKKFYADGAKARLVAQNPQFAPIITTTENVEIQGRLIAVLRSIV